MNQDKEFLGVASMLGTFLLLALIAWNAQVFEVVISELFVFISGGFREVATMHTSFLMMFPVILAVVVLELPLTVGVGVLLRSKLGNGGGHAITDLLCTMKEGNHFFTFFILVIVEELFARFLFLGVLAKTSLLSGTVAFYALFLVGNTIWALFHLANFQHKEDRHVLRVLPQFIAGIFYAYVFVKYGLLAAILAHFASNAVLFASHKIQRVSVVDVLIIGYSALCGVTSYTLMERPITDILSWFADAPEFPLKGWGFWDYVKLSVLSSSVLNVLFGLLLYDRGDSGDKKIRTGHEMLDIYVFGIPLLIGLLYGAYGLLGMFIVSVPYRVLVVAILFSFLSTGASGSATSRTFWTGLPGMFITMCILEALGVWSAVAWLAVGMLISVPTLALSRLEN